MSQRPSTYVFGGGVDETTQAMAVPRGRVIGCLNFESTATGYSRVGGYERFDGRTSPTAAFAAAQEGKQIDQREAARSAIQPVPGSGPVRGVACLKGQRYAWRDTADGAAGGMYRATSSGWAAVPLGHVADFTSGSVEPAKGDTVTGQSSGATAIVKRAVVTSGSWSKGDAAGYMVLSNVSGAFRAEAINGATADIATLSGAPIAQSFPAGGRYCTINTNFYGASNLREMYGCNGVGRGFAFDGEVVTFIRTGMIDDRPSRVSAFKRHLFFSFPGGSVQNSGTGEPLLWQPVYGASEIGVGSDVTDFAASTDALHIFTVDQVNTLTGNDAQDWSLQPLTTEENQGGVAFTAQTIGSPLYLDIGGFRSIASTQAYGNFRLGSITPQIQPAVATRRRSGIAPVASLITKAKDQYRIFYEDGSGISIYFGRKYPEPMYFAFPIRITSCCSEFDADRGEISFFGARDGYVYQADVGSSFDGAEIVAYVRLPWDAEGSADVIKRWHKVVIEMDASPDTQIGMTAEFDYGNGEQSPLPHQAFSVNGGGGFWNIDNWNEFYWAAAAEGRAEAFFDGQGENMSVLIVSTGTEELGYTLKAIRKLVTIRGQRR